MKFLCDQCKAKYQIADEKAAGKTVRMKCRKCGHLIEVRASVMESSVASAPPGGSTGHGPARPQAAQSPRPASLATSLAAAKPAAREKSAVLAGAFKSSVQHEEEVSVAAELSQLSASDEWYVAINGVPVGPIRIAEVRRKAALGGVTEESLAWQEGLDEWRPVRTFPDLAAIVREAMAAGRASLTPPPPPGRASSIPPPPRGVSLRPLTAAGRPLPPPRSTFSATPPPPAAAARSNVVAITSRLATAEKLDDLPDEALVRDPFAGAAIASAAAASGDQAGAAAQVLARTPIALATADQRSRKQPPWMAIAMVAAAIAFGAIGGLATFFRPTPAPGPAIVSVPVNPVAAPAAASAATQTPAGAEVPEPAPTVISSRKAPGVAAAAAAAAKESAAAQPGRGPLDLHSLAQNQTALAPADESDTPKAPGQCFSSAQVQQVIGLHKSGIQRACWERNPSNKLAVNVTVSFTIQSDGSTQGVSASAEESSVAKCVENDVRGWHFPALGCSQATQFSYKFVRQ